MMRPAPICIKQMIQHSWCDFRQQLGDSSAPSKQILVLCGVYGRWRRLALNGALWLARLNVIRYLALVSVVFAKIDVIVACFTIKAHPTVHPN